MRSRHGFLLGDGDAKNMVSQIKIKQHFSYVSPISTNERTATSEKELLFYLGHHGQKEPPIWS